MKVKIDTKEKFHVISLQEPELSANMTEEIRNFLLSYLKNDVRNIVLKLDMVVSLHETCAENIANIQQTYYENSCSFILCELQPAVEEFLDKINLLEVLNVTRTESEAWDIVQMEEIERELLE